MNTCVKVNFAKKRFECKLQTAHGDDACACAGALALVKNCPTQRLKFLTIAVLQRFVTKSFVLLRNPAEYWASWNEQVILLFNLDDSVLRPLGP